MAVATRISHKYSGAVGMMGHNNLSLCFVSEYPTKITLDWTLPGLASIVRVFTNIYPNKQQVLRLQDFSINRLQIVNTSLVGSI